MSVLAQGLRRHFSEQALRALASARVGIAGAGGLGSNVAMLLVRSGIRYLRVADHDLVEPSNLNRQFYWPEDVGRPKVEALRDRLLALEPELDFLALRKRLSPDEACRTFSTCTIVVEAFDREEGKASLCTSLLSGGFTVVAASGLGGWGGPAMTVRRIGDRFTCVGDGVSGVGPDLPPLAPRVMQAAALQADAVISVILGQLGQG